LAAALAVLGLGLTSCDAFGDDAAATVAGRKITIDQVRVVAAATTGDGDVTNGRLDGESSRAALALLVDYAVADAVLDELGESVTPADVEVATQVVSGQFPEAAGKGQTLLERGVAAQAALDRTMADHWDTEIGQRVLDKAYKDGGDRWNSICVVGYAGPTGSADQALALIRAGSDDLDSGLQAISWGPIGQGTPQLCAGDEQIAQYPPDQAVVFTEEPMADFAVTELAGNDGQAVSVAYRSAGRQIVRRDDPAFGELIGQQLVQAGQQGQTGLLASLVRDSVDVAIDPRFGTDLVTGPDGGPRVLPPVAPPSLTGDAPTADPLVAGP